MLRQLIPWMRNYASWIALGAVVAASLLAVSAGRWMPAIQGAQTREFILEAERFSYSPERIRVNKGDRVILRLQPQDVSHGLYIDDYGLQMEAAPGEEASLEFVADKAGTFRFRCSRTCGPLHPFMIGQLEVAPNAPFITSSVLVVVVAVGALGVGWWTVGRGGGVARNPTARS